MEEYSVSIENFNVKKASGLSSVSIQSNQEHKDEPLYLTHNSIVIGRILSDGFGLTMQDQVDRLELCLLKSNIIIEHNYPIIEIASAYLDNMYDIQRDVYKSSNQTHLCVDFDPEKLYFIAGYVVCLYSS